MSAATKKITNTKWIPLIISIVIMFGSKFISAPWGLTDGGFQVLMTLLGALILWLVVAVDWTCFLVLFSFCLTPGLGMKVVSAGTLGNDTVMFIILCFVLSSCLEKTGVSKRICIWFLTNKFARKGAWWTIVMMFISVYLIGLLSSAVATVMMALPIFYEILKELKFEKGKGEDLPAIIVYSVAMAISYSVAASPIGHAQTIIGVTSYNAYTGDAMSMVEYMAVGVPVTIVCMLVVFLLIKFVWRPDVSAMTSLDYDAIKAKLGPMSKAEKWAAVTYILVCCFWVLPGVTKDLAPTVYAAFFSKITYWYPPLIAIVLLINVQTETGPVLNFKQAMKESVPWGTCLFVGTIMFIGSTFSNTEIGLTDWLSTVLAPVVKGMNPYMFVAILLIFSVVVTNLVSNSVTVAMAFAIGMPMVMGGLFGDALDPKTLAILLTIGSNLAFVTPPSSPPVAIVCDSGWVDSKVMLKWGTIFAISGLVITFAIGLPLGNLICS